MRASLWISLALIHVALGPLQAAAQGDAKPACNMSDPDVRLTPEGWAGPNCKTKEIGGAQGRTGESSSSSITETTIHHLSLDDGSDYTRNHTHPYARPLCQRGDDHVYRTSDGWSGTDCISSRDGIHPTYTGDAARFRRSKRLCQMSDNGVQLTADGWSGPNCVTSTDGVHPSEAKAGIRGRADARPLCQINSPGVDLTPNGWSGPDCIASQDGKTPSNPDTVRQTYSNRKSCVDTDGPGRARELVHQCLQVSPATHPPCNEQDACSLITGEIRRGCSQIALADLPGFCHKYR